MKFETKYFQLRSYLGSIGVIKVNDDNNYPIDKIKEALEAHLDEGVSNISVNNINLSNDVRIEFIRENGDKDEVFGELTWLYF
jgi:hypothetical protein